MVAFGKRYAMFSDAPFDTQKSRTEEKAQQDIVAYSDICVHLYSDEKFCAADMAVRDDLMQPELRKADVVVVIPMCGIVGRTPIGLADGPRKIASSS
jgi:hypothetical protein